jgi:hypothetical protein
VFADSAYGCVAKVYNPKGEPKMFVVSYHGASISGHFDRSEVTVTFHGWAPQKFSSLVVAKSYVRNNCPKFYRSATLAKSALLRFKARHPNASVRIESDSRGKTWALMYLHQYQCGWSVASYHQS